MLVMSSVSGDAGRTMLLLLQHKHKPAFTARDWFHNASIGCKAAPQFALSKPCQQLV